ncbi:hypothetical protein ACLB2K_031645 [Fragaria x ananassa]
MQCTSFSAMSCAYERSLFVLQGCEIDTAERVSCGLRSYLLLACAIFGLGFSACGKDFAYDGEKSLFTVGSLPRNKLEFSVVLEDTPSNRNNGSINADGDGSLNESDRKRLRRPGRTKTFNVEISYAAKIPMKAIGEALRGQESENSQEALRVLDIILRQHASKQGYLLVRQSFFHNDPKSFVDVGGGVLGCRGFHSSFRTTQGGLSLNIDVSTTMIIQPGPVVDFLISSQNVRDPYLTGQRFTLRNKNAKDGEDGEIEVTVYDYFVNHRNIPLRYSGDLPCMNVGKPKRPTYIPLELCELVSLQRYTKALSTLQRSSLVEKSRQKPQERMSILSNALKINNYDGEPMLRACGVSIGNSFTQVDGRVLPAPKLKVGNGDDFFPRNGRWNFNNKKLVKPTKIERWVVVNFSARCDLKVLVRDLIKCGDMKGIAIDPPFDVFEENPQSRRAPPMVRVERMFEDIQSKLPGQPQFILCLLPERKNSALYGPWKRKNLAEYGIVTQCIAPTRVNDQYLTNVLLKINAKLGGLNSLLAVEFSPSIPVVSKAPTIILGMDVSWLAWPVVSSRHWPLISRYRASVRTQSPKVEMIDSLFKRVSDTEDDGIMRELLLDFYTSSGKRKPDQIIIFRDGVSESQFNQVLNIELDQIIEGTTRPTYYHVLLDDVGFSADDLQELVHSLSYVYQRSTTAISVVAPICYAHLAATQMSQFVKFEDASETSSSHGGTTSAGAVPVPQLPRKEADVGFLDYWGRTGKYNEESTLVEFYYLPPLYPDSRPQVDVICLTAVEFFLICREWSCTSERETEELRKVLHHSFRYREISWRRKSWLGECQEFKGRPPFPC